MDKSFFSSVNLEQPKDEELGEAKPCRAVVDLHLPRPGHLLEGGLFEGRRDEAAWAGENHNKDIKIQNTTLGAGDYHAWGGLAQALGSSRQAGDGRDDYQLQVLDDDGC